jgi:DNA-binding winged helix-turn-helix (wHTH) protein/tetratricopeptide (TPR) repeat protein
MLYVIGDYTLDTRRYELRRAGELIALRPKVFHVLAYLIEHRDRVVPKQELFEHLWPERFVSDVTLDSCITEARRALGDDGRTQHTIQTRRGHGYRFVAVVDTQSRVTTVSQAPSVPLTSHASSEQVQEQSEAQVTPVSTRPGARREPTTSSPASSSLHQPLHGERKQVTVLACTLAHASVLATRLELEAWYTLMHRFFALAREVIQHYEGTIQHFGDGGFVAFFGMPIAHEDHAQRAVLAALSLHQCLHQHRADLGHPQEDIAVSMGLHSGPVITGRIGDDLQQAALPVGNVTQMADQLLSLAAPGTILLSDATWQLGRQSVRAEVVESGHRKGMAFSRPVYRVLGRQSETCTLPRGRTWSPFVGREREMAALHELLAQVENGWGQVVGIVGEPGMGKSRLLYEFRQHVMGRKHTYFAGQCHSYGRTTPYLPLSELLRHAWEMTEAENAEALTAKLYSGLQSHGMAPEVWAPYLLQLLGVRTAAEGLTDLNPQARKTRTFEALLQMCLHRCRQAPLVLEIENLHWIDPTSEEWLMSLVDRLAGVPILLLLSSRPGYRPPWIDKSYVTQLALQRLSYSDSQRVVRAVLHAAQVPESLVHVIVAKADGNPFFLEEFARTVVGQEAQHLTLTVPDTIQAVLAARIDRLPSEAKYLLQVAAVIGKEVPISLLQAVTELPETACLQGLDHVQTAEFLYETRLFPDPVYTFKHALTQEVAYESLLHERRRALHAQIVETIEALAGDRVTDQVERLAYHALRGEVWDKAVIYFRQAGARAMERSAYREARVCFEQAMSSLQHLPEGRTTHQQAVDLRLDLRSALLPFGEFTRILDCLREAESAAESLDDSERLGRVSLAMSVHFYLMGEYDRAMTFGQRALALAIASGEVDLQAVASNYLGYSSWAQGIYGQAIDFLRRTVECLEGERLPRRFGHVIPAIVSRSYLARCYAEVGSFAKGRSIGEEGLRIAEAIGHPLSLVYACLGASLPSLRKGDLHRALPLLERAVGMRQDMDLPLYFPMVAAPLGAAYVLGGQVADALPLLEQAVQQGASLGGTAHQTLCLMSLAEAYVRAGKLQESHDHAWCALERSRTHKEGGHQAYALRLLGDIAMQSGPADIESAEASYRQALALASELGMRPLLAHCHRGLGTLYSTVGRVKRARMELGAAIELYRAMEMSLWLHQAESALVQIEGG